MPNLRTSAKKPAKKLASLVKIYFFPEVMDIDMLRLSPNLNKNFFGGIPPVKRGPRCPNKTCCATNLVKANNAASKTRSSLRFVQFFGHKLGRVEPAGHPVTPAEKVFGPIKYA